MVRNKIGKSQGIGQCQFECFNASIFLLILGIELIFITRVAYWVAQIDVSHLVGPCEYFQSGFEEVSSYYIFQSDHLVKICNDALFVHIYDHSMLRFGAQKNKTIKTHATHA